jgi:Septum formation inhibitor-activating ATPase
LKVFAVTSGNGGVGKSCVAAYLGVAFAKMGKKSLLVEAGAQARSLDMITATRNTVFDFADVAAGACSPADAITPTGLQAALSLLAGPPLPVCMEGNRLDCLSAEDFAGFDIVILDGVYDALPHQLVDTIILVTTPESMSVRACEQYAGALRQKGLPEIRLVINQVPAQVLPMQDIRDFDDIIDRIGAQLLGVVPRSPKLQYSANNGLPISEQSLTVQIFDNIAARLTGDIRPLLVC